jgi:WD40 repeat protein
VLFSPDGRLLASGARFWQVANGRPMNALRSPVPPAERTTYAWDSLALSPDGGLLAWGNLDGLFLFGLPSAGPIAATPTPLPGVTVQAGDTFYNIAETLDVSLPALLSANGLSCSHVPYIGQALQPPVQPGYDPASGQVVSQPLEAANIHRLTELHRLLRDCAGPPGHVSLSVGGAPGGQVVASSASLWRIRRGSLFIQSGSPDARDFSPALVFSPDGSLLAVRSANEIELWDVASGRLLRTLSGHTDRVVALAFSPDGRRLASVSDVDEGHIRLWDLDSSQTVKTFTGFSAERLTFSPDGARLIAELSGSARFYDVQTGGLLNTLQGVQGSLATSQNPGVIAFAACSKWQGDNCLNSVINLYRTSDWKISGTLLGQKDIVHSPAFSPDGRYLAAAAEYTISVWQIENGVSISGQPVYKLRARPDNQEIIHHVFFSPDGSLMVSVSTANVVRFWRITDGELIATLPVQPDEIAFAPDGRGLAVRVGDQVSVWGVAP